MLTLNDGRSELWQWDTGRKLTVDADCTQVHFSNKFFGRSVDVDVVDGVAEIPDVLLQVDKDLLVWAFVGTAENGYTKISKAFKVNKRNKPADYVFTPTEQTTLDEIMKRLDRIEESQDPDAIKNAVDEYLANNPIQTEEEDPTVPDWAKQPTKPKYTAQEVGAVATVNGTAPDENGNVEIEIPEASEPDMTGYATERYVQENYQQKGNYLTKVPEGYAKAEDIPTKPEDIGAQPAGNYLTEVPSGYATEEFVKNKIAEAELGGEEVDLSGYAQKSELPTKVSELENDAGYLTEHQDLSDYAKKTELPVVPVQSVNGKTGSVKLSASDVGARPSSWMPTAQEVGALPDTYVPPNQTAAQVGADPAGTATAAVSTHNTSTDSHGDLRLELKAINDRLTAFFDSDNQTLDELSEIVAYITSNKALIDSITTSKVSVVDIINNLTTNVANKPLSAAQGVVLKGLIDAVSNSLSNYQPKGDYALASAIPTKVSQLQNDKGYLTEHQDISGKLDADKLPEAVNAALAQAKDSGEFDGDPGAPGVTPHIGSNGNWYIGSADTGVKAQGKDGTSVTVKSVSESTADGGSNVVTFSDGKTLTVKNGERGSAGKTPIRGVDYYTEADKAEFSEYIASELAKRGQLKPEFAESLEWLNANGDHSKLYVLPDGFIYAYMLTEVETGPAYTNVLPSATDTSGAVYNGVGYKNGYRLNSSCVEKGQANAGHTGFIPATSGAVLRIKNIEACNEGHGYIHYFKSDKATTALSAAYFGKDAGTVDENGVHSFTLATNADIAYIRFSYGLMSADSIITINEEIVEGRGTTTEYAWANTGHAFVPADYEDRIVDLENKVASLEDDVSSRIDLLYISPDGDDSNSGLTASTPKKTVKACVNAGATRICAKRGVYNEFIELSNIGELEIFPTDNDLEYVVGEEREPIVFDTSDSVELSGLAAYNSIKRVAYSNGNNTQFDKVFTKNSLTPIAGDGYGSKYNSTVWLLSSDEKAVCIKLKPVLTVAECEAEANTFTYVSGYIYINANLAGVEKIVVPTNWGTGFYINGADRLVLREVEVRFSGTYNIDIRNCAYFDFYKCACKYTSYGSGFHPFNSNGRMTACYATKNYDGYGISGYGHTTYVDCVSEFNFDDGMSHHSGTSGTVIGGRFEGNGKGGCTPAYGAKVNIYGGLYKDNASFGIGYLWATDLEPASGMVQGAVMVGNPKGLVINANCPVTAISCVYKDNTTDKENKGLLTEY